MKNFIHQRLPMAFSLLILFACAVAACSVMPDKSQKRNLYDYYKNQDTKPEGKVGLFITGLIMPERLDDDPDFFYQASKKVKNILPAEVYKNISKDTGVVLLDTQRFHEAEEFVPTELVDHLGNKVDIDGVPYIDKYRAGKAPWVKSKNETDYGYFLLSERKGGWPDRVQKSTNHARLWYYGHGLIQEGLPHQRGVTNVVNGGLEKIRAKYGDVPYKFNNAESPEIMKKDMFDLLDSGVETVVLVSTQVIFSNFEAFESSFVHAFDYVEQWQQANERDIKIIIAPPIGHQPGMRVAYLEMLDDRLVTLASSDKIKVLLTSHGMNWKANPNEPYLLEEPKYTTPLKKEMQALLDERGFKNTDIFLAQDKNADDSVDPDQEYLSTNEGYMQGIEEGYDFVITLPITFYAENSDTLFGHAVGNFNGLPTYDLYERIDYPDWDQPLVRKFKAGSTTIIYNGLPVGKYAKYIEDSYFTSVDSVLSQM